MKQHRSPHAARHGAHHAGLHHPAPPHRDHAGRRRSGVCGPLVALILLSLSLPWALGMGQSLPRARVGEAAPRAALSSREARLLPADRDRDGLADSQEDELLQRYAPTVLLSGDDPSLPASVGWIRTRINLALDGPRLMGVLVPGRRMDRDTRRGSEDPADWTMYGHAYPRADGGVNLQYWFYHPYNYGPVFVFDHESDWEHVTVELGADLVPRSLALSQHHHNAPGIRVDWRQVPREGDHAFVLSARGTHASYLSAKGAPFWERVPDCPRDASGLPQLEQCPVRVWRAGDPASGRLSPLVNVGEHRAPRLEADADGFFIRYSGLWGEATASAVPVAASPAGPPYQRGFCVDARPGTCD